MLRERRPGEAAGDGVDAHGFDQRAQCGAPGEDCRQDEDGCGDQDGDRKGEQVSGADRLVGVVGDGDDLAAGDELGDAAPCGHEHQGGNDGLHADGRDQEAVPDAQGKAGDDGDENRRRCRHRGAGFRRGSDVGARGRPGDGHHGAHREVNAPGGDHQGHAERDEDRGGAIAHDVDEAAVQVPVLHPEAQEVRPEDLVQQQQCCEGDHRPRKAVFQK